MTLLVLGIGLVTVGCQVETEEAMADTTPAPDTTRRYVEGNVFTSTYLPAIRIEIDEALSYVGMMDFILKDIAQVERYVFVEADAQQRIERMIVFQFEGFLDNNDHYYRYRFIDPDTLGGLAFNHNTWYYDDAVVRARNPGAESERTRAFLEARGYTLENELMMSRFVAVVDEAKRHELILFYFENVRDTGFALAEIATDDGDIRPEHAAVEEGLIQRSRRYLTVLPAADER